jgi:phosphocarrier protein HPr
VVLAARGAFVNESALTSLRWDVKRNGFVSPLTCTLLDLARRLMASNSQPLWRDVTIVNELGLHARSAAKLAKAAQAAAGGVWIEVGGERVDAKEIIDILTLGASQGVPMRVGIERPDDRDVLETIVGLFAGGFGE